MVPIYRRRRVLRRFVPSKILLLYGVIRNDNSANNGGTSNLQDFCGPKILMNWVGGNTVGSQPHFAKAKVEFLISNFKFLIIRSRNFQRENLDTILLKIENLKLKIPPSETSAA